MDRTRVLEGHRFDTILAVLSSSAMPELNLAEVDGIMKLFSETELMVIKVLRSSGTALNVKQIFDNLVLDLYHLLLDKKHKLTLWSYDVSSEITDEVRQNFQKSIKKRASKIKTPLNALSIEAIRQAIVENKIAELPSFNTIKSTLEYLAGFGIVLDRHTAEGRGKQGQKVYALTPRFNAIVAYWEGHLNLFDPENRLRL